MEYNLLFKLLQVNKLFERYKEYLEVNALNSSFLK